MNKEEFAIKVFNNIDVKSARKGHECDMCYTKIEIGEGYNRFTWACGADIGHTKTCECCQAFAKAFPESAKFTNEEGTVFIYHENYAEFAADFAINKLLT